MAAEDGERVLTAAEKRAARRARVLQGGENRLKLVTGQISTLKETESESTASALDKEMDSALNELLDATEDGKSAVVKDSEAKEAEAVADPRFALRPSPAQRRREAALRREQKEAIVQELLAPLTAAKANSEPTAAATAVTASVSSVNETAKAVTKPAKAPATFSRHAFALKLHSFEEKAILLVILAAAVYFAMMIDLGSIATDLDTKDQILVSYQELLAQGLPLDSIRQQMEREQLDTPVVERIERLLSGQFRGKEPDVSFTSSFLPNVWDVPEFFASLVYRPPVILCVLLVRLVIASIVSGVHFAFSLPDVKNPQDDDLGFVVNLVLSSKPALKGYLIKFRKSLDDVFFFLYALLVTVALRAIWTAHFA